jgi:CMP-N-acetylneuraminic acid synthetase
MAGPARPEWWTRSSHGGAMPDALLAVIPARGGSKRIPRKNLRPLGGRPLLVHSIEAALASGLFHRTIVSTDCEEIAELASLAGAEVPFIRAATLADDHTPVSQATVDVLRRIDPLGETFGAVAQLMATCPFRTAADVRASYQAFGESGAPSQLSVTRFGGQNPWWALKLSENQTIEPVFEALMTERSQDLPPLFCPTGAIWWAAAEVLCREGTYHVAGRTGWEIAWERGLDIDTEDDWWLAETLWRRLHDGRGRAD